MSLRRRRRRPTGERKPAPAVAAATDAGFPHALSVLAQDRTRERVSLQDIIDAMAGRSTAALILLLALPNALPSVPGTSAVLGAPLLLLSVRMGLGRSAWLPRWMASASIARPAFAAWMERAAPWTRRAHRLLRPRWPALSGATARRWVGALCSVLALVVSLPIPFGNMLPALAISILAAGVLQRDGLWVTGGAVVALLSLGVMAGGLATLAELGVRATASLIR
jgi:hypothetical protein